MKSTEDRVAKLLESGFAAPGTKVAVVGDQATVGTVTRHTATMIMVTGDRHGFKYRFYKDTLTEVGSRTRRSAWRTHIELLPLDDERVITKRIAQTVSDVRFKVDKLLAPSKEQGFIEVRALLDQAAREIEAIKAGED